MFYIYLLCFLKNNFRKLNPDNFNTLATLTLIFMLMIRGYIFGTLRDWYHLYNFKNVKDTHSVTFMFFTFFINGIESRKASPMIYFQVCSEVAR